MLQPKPKKKAMQKGAPMMDVPRMIDTEKMRKEDEVAQGGKTPRSVMNQIAKDRAYDVKMKSGNGARIAAILKQDPKMAARINVKPSGVTKELMMKNKGKVTAYSNKKK
jgi:hypothetical protein